MTERLLRIGLDPDAVTLAAGQQTTVEVSLRNTTGRVGDFQVGIVNPRGIPLVASAKEVNLKVGESTTVPLTLSMPADARPTAGDQLVGIQVSSTSVALTGATEELHVTIPVSGDATLRVEPEVSRNGRFTLHAASQATAPLQLALAGHDDEGSAKFTMPATLDVSPFGHASAEARVRASRPFTGEERRRKLTFEAAGPGGAPLLATATLVREPLVPSGPFKALGKVLALILALILLAAAIIGGTIVANKLSNDDNQQSKPAEPAEQVES
jgi:hypothetical protein